MKKELDILIDLSKKGYYEQYNGIVAKTVEKFFDSLLINYKSVWNFYLLGEEAKAVSFCEKLIQLGLTSGELEGVITVLGSAYRISREYEKSKIVF